ncbi:GtrA family protein [Paenibacillus sp. P46E]|uniref:GtrA family protein n=1 Tax=Paenibacillus sp. P46E TaxID=1349436 RepID=UPI0009388C71|nr:GtrA family protein [Paenibacillus sp. P46E]
MINKVLNRFLSNQFISYVFVGGIGTLAHTGTLWLLTELADFNPLLSSTCGFFLSLIISYYLNSILTFKQKFHIHFFLKYLAVSLTGLLVNLSIIYTVQNILNWNYMIGQLISIVVVPILNFALNKYWAFTSKTDMNGHSGGVL